MRIAVLGVDLGKNVCSLVGLNASGAVVLRRRAKRETSRWRRSYRLALWGWRRAAAPTILAASSPLTGMTCG